MGSRPETPFVGRSAEVDRLAAAIAEAMRGRGRLVLVAGEPGIGKTTLVERTLHASRAGRLGDSALAAGMAAPLALWGRCWEGEGSPPFWPWTHALRDYVLTQRPSDLADELGGDAALVAQIVPQLRDRFPELPALPLGESEQARFRLFDRFAAFLKVAAATQPLIVVLDDLHWADVASVRLLEFAAREIGDAPIAIVATYRDTDTSPDHPLFAALGTLLREPLCSRIELGGLDARECGLFAGHLSGTPVDEALARALHDRTSGNPLFVGEVVRYLVAERRLDGAGAERAWRSAVPGGLVEIISRRLTALGPEARPILQLAALLGDELEADLLEAVAAALDPSAARTEDVLAALDRAIEARLLVADPDAPEQLRFAHALVADTLRAEVRGLRRARVHARIAETIEARHPLALASRAEELAWHFGQAGRSFTERALHYASLGARSAMARCAYEDAARLYELALRQLAELGHEGAERVACKRGLAEALQRAGQLREARAAYEDVLIHARREHAPRLFAETALALAYPVPEIGRSDPDLSHLLEEAAGMVASEDPALRSRLASRLAMELWPVDYARAGTLAREAIDLARASDDPRALAYAYYARFGGEIEVDLAEASREMLLAGEQAGDKELIAEARVQRLRRFIGEGDPARAEAEIDALSRLAAESHQPRHLWIAHLVRTSWLISRGHLAEAERWARETAAIGARAQEPNADQVLAAQIGVILYLQGHSAEVRPYLEALVAERPEFLGWRSALAYCYVETDDLPRAARLLEGTDDFAARIAVRHSTSLPTLGYLARTAAAVADRERSGILYQQLRPMAGRNLVDDVSSYGSADHPLALLAAALGRDDAAREHFERALAMNRRMGALPYLAETQLAYAGHLASEPAERHRTDELLAEALASARRLGMRRIAERAAAALSASASMSGATRAAAPGLGPGRPGSEARAEPGVPGEPAERAVHRNVFRREGEFWRVEYGGTLAHLRDAKALHYLATLLRDPGRERHVTDLAGLHGEGSARTTGEDLNVSSLGEVELADATAKAAYRRRLEGLRDALAEAQERNELQRATAIREEMEFLAAELGSRLRAGSHALHKGAIETVRSAVTKALRRQLAKIRLEHAPLGHHLTASLHIGLLCSYQPEAPVEWEL